MSEVISIERDAAMVALIEDFKQLPQIDCPVKHHFAPHVYVRECLMPKGSIVIGKKHKTEHLNIMESGSMWLVDNEGRREFIKAPQTFVSRAGVQKAAYILEDVIWKTIHVTDNTNIEELESELTEGPSVLEKPKELLT